jgi:hypothetical protein
VDFQVVRTDRAVKLRAVHLDSFADLRRDQVHLTFDRGAVTQEQALDLHAVAAEVPSYVHAASASTMPMASNCWFVGLVRRAQGDLAGALAAYEQGLAIAERLAALDARNTQWQRDLAYSQQRVTELRQQAGKMPTG